MVKRKRIGIIYSYSEQWIGGTYYVENLIKALSKLEDNRKPFLKIICTNRNDLDRIGTLNYPYFKVIVLNSNLILRVLNKIGQRVFGTRMIDKIRLRGLDALFPIFSTTQFQYLHCSKRIFWIPDFQHHYLPQYFPVEDIGKRNNTNKLIASSGNVLLLSSKTALEDFMQLYSPYNCVPKVVNFAVTHPHLDDKRWDEINKLYKLPENYFFIPNQFWQHKNHKVVLEALNLLLDKCKPVNFIFSGKENDYRNQEYTNDLKAFVEQYKLTKYCWFLGFIPREHQLLIMKNAIAVVQPSLFEGWSTVVEDAKSLSKCVIASNIETHLEQLGDQGVFFDPSSPEQLVEIIVNTELKFHIDYQYPEKVHEFGLNFMKIVNKL